MGAVDNASAGETKPKPEPARPSAVAKARTARMALARFVLDEFFMGSGFQEQGCNFLQAILGDLLGCTITFGYLRNVVEADHRWRATHR